MVSTCMRCSCLALYFSSLLVIIGILATYTKINLKAFCFVKNMSVLMIQGLMTDFEIIFTVDFSKLLGKIMILFPSLNTSTNIGNGPLKNSGDQSRAILALLLPFPQCFLLINSQVQSVGYI